MSDLENKHIIYKTTNLVNGKIYVGQHKPNKYRTYLGSGRVFLKAIKKYGKNNFIREILEYCNKEIVDEREIYWIDKLNATNKEIGYNVLKGGNTVKWTPEMRENANKSISEKLKGKSLKESTKQKLSEYNKNFGNPFYGKQHSDKQKQKWSNDRKGKVYDYMFRKRSEETKNKIGKISKLRTSNLYFFISPEGIEYNNIENLQDFCDKFGWKQNNFKFKFDEWTKYKNWKIKKVRKEKGNNEQ